MVEWRTDADEVGQDAVRRFSRSYLDKLIALALFGSRARGDQRPDSDIDLLLIARDLPPTGSSEPPGYRKPLREMFAPTSVLAYGKTRKEALASAEALALRVVADRLEQGETLPERLSVSFVASA